MATGVAVRCLRDARCRQCTGKQLSRAIWSSFNKERMSHLCDSTVAGPTARRDNVLASKCEYPPFRYPPFKCALNCPMLPDVKLAKFDGKYLFQLGKGQLDRFSRGHILPTILFQNHYNFLKSKTINSCNFNWPRMVENH